MGQRNNAAAFMPSKFVFPGGALENDDADIDLVGNLDHVSRARLHKYCDSGPKPEALASAAIRELWEETGLRLGQSGDWPNPPLNWGGFAANGFVPAASALRFFFRAVTPPGRPRRFDARFFLADANDVVGDLDNLDPVMDELSRLQWVPVSEARDFDLPFITELVLAELCQHLPSLAAPKRVPFVRNDRLDSQVTWLD